MHFDRHFRPNKNKAHGFTGDVAHARLKFEEQLSNLDYNKVRDYLYEDASSLQMLYVSRLSLVIFRLYFPSS